MDLSFWALVDIDGGIPSRKADSAKAIFETKMAANQFKESLLAHIRGQFQIRKVLVYEQKAQ